MLARSRSFGNRGSRVQNTSRYHERLPASASYAKAWTAYLKQAEVLSEMQENALRLTTFVQNLLACVSMEADRFEMQYEMGDVNECIREIAELWSQRFHDKAIAFYFFPAEKIASFPFDWFKLQHVVSNLLDNAIKYTAAHGTVWLHVEPHFWERRNGGKKAVADRRLKHDHSPNCCRISVCDTGPGIEPQYQQEYSTSMYG